MQYRIGLADYGDFVHAWVLDLPGCLAGGPTLAEALANLPLVVAEHRAWLDRHGETTDEPEGWPVVETVDGRAHPDVLFAAESSPVGAAELARLVRRLGFARDALIETLAALPPEVQSWEPPATAFASFDPWAKDVRNIMGVARHVLELEAYYRGGLHDGPSVGIREALQDPDAERALTLGVLNGLPATERGRVFHPLRPGAAEPEAWTLRKVIRRIISHDRAHHAEIVQRWTWVLLGAPKVERA